MDQKPTIVNFPVTPLQKSIPTELEMTRLISKELITTDFIFAKLEEAGYEVLLEEDEIFVMRTGCNLRIQNYPDHVTTRIRVQYYLNPELSQEEINELVTKVNYDSFLLKLCTVRWDDGDLGLIGTYVYYYPFGFNMPNFIFILRKVIDAMKDVYENNKNNKNYFVDP
jgi:hypothetical protein